jgi:protocatechuate 3,4-dioxygenase beta subunit
MHSLKLRREFLRFGAVAATALIWSDAAEAEDCAETESNIEGPFYKAGAPERSSIWEPGMQGTQLVITGVVRNQRCEPIPYALLDVWQCDAAGVYDNTGYTMRGKLKADGKGRYELTTIAPPAYKVSAERYRPAHIHLKLSGQGTKLLTTQLYFDGDSWNAKDNAYRKSLTLTPKSGPNGSKKASYNFQLRVES